MGSFMDVVEDGMLRSNTGLPAHAHIGCIQLHLDHMSAAHPATLRHAVDQSLVQIEDQCLLWRLSVRLEVDIGWLSAGNQWPRRCWCLGVLCQSPSRRGG